MTEINPMLLKQLGISQSIETTNTNNPHNIIKIQTAKGIGEIAKKEIGRMPYRIATAGYTAPPENYENSTKLFLQLLDNELGTRSTAFVTSPTADKGSIDAITSEVTGLNNGKVFYITAQDYVEYINPRNFPPTINTTTYSKIPKFVLPSTTEYSKATAEASNIFVSTGGRNATVSDFVNAIKKGNKAVILNNKTIDAPAWGEAKNRVENASKYILEQLEAFNEGKKLPYPEVGDFTLEFIKENKTKLNRLVKIITIDTNSDKNILNGAKQAADFIR